MQKKKGIFLLITLTLLLSGCWSKRELNELAIVMALGVDKIDDEFEVSIQVVAPSEVSSKQPSSGRSPVVTYHATGKTIFEAIRKITKLAPRKPYFSHLQVVVLGEKLAIDGINPALDFIARDHEFRNDFDVIVSRDATAKEILNVLTPIEKVPANKMLNSIQASEKSWGSTVSVNISELVNTLNSKNKSAVLSVIEILGDPKLGIDQTNVERIKTPVVLHFAGLGVFKNDRLTGVLTDEESRNINFLNDKIESTIEIISCPEKGKLATEISKSKTKINGEFENLKPKIKISIDIQQNVGEVDCNIDLTKSKTIKYINKKTEELIKERTNKTINTIQQNYKVDIFGFGEELHRSNPKEWKKIKNDWQTIFPDLEITVEVHVATQATGTVQNSLLYDSKEE